MATVISWRKPLLSVVGKVVTKVRCRLDKHLAGRLSVSYLRVRQERVHSHPKPKKDRPFPAFGQPDELFEEQYLAYYYDDEEWEQDAAAFAAEQEELLETNDWEVSQEEIDNLDEDIDDEFDEAAYALFCEQDTIRIAADVAAAKAKVAARVAARSQSSTSLPRATPTGSSSSSSSSSSTTVAGGVASLHTPA
jgi:hypothetical protein